MAHISNFLIGAEDGGALDSTAFKWAIQVTFKKGSIVFDDLQKANKSSKSVELFAVFVTLLVCICTKFGDAEGEFSL